MSWVRARFGDYDLDTERYELLQDGTPVALQPRTFDLLVHLVSHAGKLVTRDDLFEAVWGEVHVSEAALTQAVAALRRVLGDTGVGQSLVRTVRGRGYRFAAAVRFESEELYKAS